MTGTRIGTGTLAGETILYGREGGETVSNVLDEITSFAQHRLLFLTSNLLTGRACY
jgi:hypothetical protein